MPFYGRCVPSVIVHALNFTIKQADDIIKNRGGNTVRIAQLTIISSNVVFLDR